MPPKRKASSQKGSKVTKKPAMTKSLSMRQERVFLARKSLSSADVKVHYVSVVPTGISAAAAVQIRLVDPTTLVPGTGATNQYVGNKINPIGLTVRYTVNIADTTNTVRVSIFQFDGDVSGLTLYDNYLIPTNPLSPIQAFPVRTNNTLHDKIYTGGYLSGTYSDNQCQNCTVYIKGKNLLPIHFSNAGADVSSGAIYICALSDSTVASHPYITAYSDLKFLDS